MIDTIVLISLVRYRMMVDYSRIIWMLRLAFQLNCSMPNLSILCTIPSYIVVIGSKKHINNVVYATYSYPCKYRSRQVSVFEIHRGTRGTYNVTLQCTIFKHIGIFSFRLKRRLERNSRNNIFINLHLIITIVIITLTKRSHLLYTR